MDETRIPPFTDYAPFSEYAEDDDDLGPIAPGCIAVLVSMTAVVALATLVGLACLIFMMVGPASAHDDQPVPVLSNSPIKSR
jgi:hypothetical protein